MKLEYTIDSEAVKRLVLLSNMILALIGFLLLAGWLGYLTYRFQSLSSHYNSLTGGIDNKKLQELLDTLLSDVRNAQKEVKELNKRVEVVESDGKLHIQKIGLLRFNPFNDTGGDQSFILALIDTEESGVVVSGLHTRNGTRWYAKKVEQGKGVEHELSSDELKAIKSATRRVKNKA